MHNIESVPPAVVSRFHHWTLFVAGIVLFVLGPVWFVAQYRLKNLESCGTCRLLHPPACCY